LYREVEALRLRNQLDPKRFYKKDEREGKGIKGLPKYFAVRFSFIVLQSDVCGSKHADPDWYYLANHDTIRHCQLRQPHSRKPQEDTCGRVGGRCGGETIREEKVRGPTISPWRKGTEYVARKAGSAEIQVVGHRAVDVILPLPVFLYVFRMGSGGICKPSSREKMKLAYATWM